MFQLGGFQIKSATEAHYKEHGHHREYISNKPRKVLRCFEHLNSWAKQSTVLLPSQKLDDAGRWWQTCAKTFVFFVHLEICLQRTNNVPCFESKVVQGCQGLPFYSQHTKANHPKINRPNGIQVLKIAKQTRQLTFLEVPASTKKTQ